MALAVSFGTTRRGIGGIYFQFPGMPKGVSIRRDYFSHREAASAVSSHGHLDHDSPHRPVSKFTTLTVAPWPHDVRR